MGLGNPLPDKDTMWNVCQSGAMNKFIQNPNAGVFPADKAEFVPDREWLHIAITDGGDLYIFTDDGHWKGNGQDHWEDSTELTFKQLDGECFVGNVHDMMVPLEGMFTPTKQAQFRIRLKGPTYVTKLGKFGVPYLEEK